MAAGLAGVAIVFAAASGAVGNQSLRVTVDVNSLSVDAGAVEIAEYRYDDVPFKPYIKELYTPDGVNVLLDAPHDHLHHHGLMFAVAVDGVDFWAETPQAGRQGHVRFADVVNATGGEEARAGFVERLHWLDPGGQKLLVEERAIVVDRPPGQGITVLQWESRLAAPMGKASVTLTGSHYFGLGLRFIRRMDEKGTFHNADGKPGEIFRGEERLVRSAWCAYTARVDGDDVTVAMFGHPDNPRHPATWFTMAEPFAYLSATLGLHEKPLEIVEGKPVKLRYAVVLWDARPGSETIDRVYQQWVRTSGGDSPQSIR